MVFHETALELLCVTTNILTSSLNALCFLPCCYAKKKVSQHNYESKSSR